VREKGIAVNPALQANAKTPVVLDNKGCMFEPHVVVLRTGQPLLLKNSDSVAHNTKADLLKNDSFNDLIPANADMEKAGLTKEESLPLPVSCSIHPWMTGVLLIRDNPYTAVSAADGTFEIKDLPAGEPIEFQFWQEKVGNLKGIQGTGLTADSKGRAKLTLKVGVNDLGDIKIPAAVFAGK
jgi:plastocyanin